MISEEPDPFIGSPMCKDFSPWQRLNKAKSDDPEKYVTAKQSAREHLEFSCRMYMIQYKNDRIFLHEHPLQASSWDEECIKKILSLPGVEYVDMDQCQLGQCDEHGNPVKKPTRWMSNSRHILDALRHRCQGRLGWCWQNGEWKRHTPCHGKVATAAAIYPLKLCRAISEGLVQG